MFRFRLPALRAILLALLVLGTVVRPMLALACDVHAAVFAHASQPHEHAHDADAADAGDAHGVHESLNLSALSATAESVAALGVPHLGVSAPALPSHDAVPCDPQHRLAPFRPPIA